MTAYILYIQGQQEGTSSCGLHYIRRRDVLAKHRRDQAATVKAGQYNE